jgi:carotenoid cleavage dioxygenase
MNIGSVEHPFLDAETNFAPLRMEVDASDLVIKGALPPELDGDFYRQGPSQHFPPRDGAAWHWFSADGMTHKIAIRDGRASYRNRYMRTPSFTLEQQAGRSLFGTFGNPITSDPSVVGVAWGTANTNLAEHNGRLFALEEGSRPFEIDPDSLASLGYCDFGGGLKGPMTAHPKKDAATGELVAFAYTDNTPFSRDVGIRIINAEGVVTRDETFEAPYACMMHDFGVTQNHLIFGFFPAVWSIERVMTGRSPLYFDPSQDVHIGILRRDAPTATMKWFTMPACYVFHAMNAFEKDGVVYWDVIRYDKPPLVEGLDGQFPAVSETPGFLERWSFDLSKSAPHVRRDRLSDTPGELPRMDERLTGRPYRYGYWATQTRSMPQAPMYDGVAQIDLETGATQVYAPGDGSVFGEPIFAPRSSDAAEGDGFVLSLVYLPHTRTSRLMIFDAASITAGPRAHIELPVRVPNGHHNIWRART